MNPTNQLPRIAIFAPSLTIGGAERAMIKLAGGIAERGYQVDMVLSQASGEYLNELSSSVRLIDLHAPRQIASLPALMRYLRTEKPTVILSVLHANLLAVWAKLLTRSRTRMHAGARTLTRVIISERNATSAEIKLYRSDWRIKFMPLLIRTFYPRADAIVAVSNYVAQDLASVAHLPPERIQTIYNPIITPEFQKLAETPLDHPWFQSDEPPVILSVGRLEPEKDYPTLLRAFAIVSKNRLARLMILGEGSERPALEALIQQLNLSESVSLPGFVQNPYPYMKNAAVFVLPSRLEGLPGVLIEALYCGCPIIATDCPGGTREILRDEQYGKLVPVSDAAAMADAMSTVLKNPATPPPPQSWQPYEMETIVNQYLELLLNGTH